MNLLIVDDEILAIQGLVDDMDWKKLILMRYLQPTVMPRQ